MKKKWNWNNPITWKGYAKLCGISLLLSAVVSGFVFLYGIRKFDKEFMEKEDESED